MVHQLILLVIFSSHFKQDFYLFCLLELSNKRIDLKSLVGVFIVLGAGLLLAFLTLIAEVLYKRKRKQKVIENWKKKFLILTDLYTFKISKLRKMTGVDYFL